jgi:hypothetical protein
MNKASIFHRYSPWWIVLLVLAAVYGFTRTSLEKTGIPFTSPAFIGSCIGTVVGLFGAGFILSGIVWLCSGKKIQDQKFMKLFSAVILWLAILGICGKHYQAISTSEYFYPILLLAVASTYFIVAFVDVEEPITASEVPAFESDSIPQTTLNSSGVCITPKPSSANPTTPIANDPIESLAKLKQMLDAGLIEPSDYAAKKDEILSRI